MNVERISIICLIYQSCAYAEFFYENLIRHTPEIETGEAEFYFIANDAKGEVLSFLHDKDYPHFINNNPHYTKEELFVRGYAFPEYMARVYMGYNTGMRIAKTPIVMLVSSDNCFSPNWLPNLKKRLTHDRIVSPRLIQPDMAFPNPINHTECEVFDFGKGIDSFDEDSFLGKVREISANTEDIGNAFMPFMAYKNTVERVGYYPEGNLHNGSFDWILRTGDTEFYFKLDKNGVKHITSNDSIVYHFNEGEKYLKTK